MDGNSSTGNKIPYSIQKEMDKRQISENVTNIATSLRRHNSWEHSRSSSGNSTRVKSKGSDSADSVTKKRASPHPIVE